MSTIALAILEIIRVAQGLIRQHEFDEMELVELNYRIEELKRYGENKSPRERDSVD